MPNPFDLFTKKEKENIDHNNPTQEGMTGTVSNNTLAGSPDQNIALAGVLVAAFFILVIFMGLIYYFNSSFAMLTSLLTPVLPGKYYRETEFNQIFGGKFASNYFVIFIILWLAVFGINILVLYTGLGYTDYGTICYVTTLYFFGIVGSTMAMINNIPSLVEVFENTIGYSVLSWFSNTKDLSRIFKNKMYSSDISMNNLGISVNNDFLLTTFNLPNFHDHFDALAGDNSDLGFKIDVQDVYDGENITDKLTQARRDLLEVVLQKYTVGHFVWILLASYSSMLMTLNSITT
jgi:hypothetical protein